MQLDEHSVYMDSYEYENLMIDTKGEFGGLGITLGQIAGYPTVVSTLEDTPAYRLGIQGGDKIVEIEGVSTKDWKTEQAVTKLRGREGTQVVLTITREGLPDSLHYTITREIIRVPSITYSTNLDGIGYIRVSRFAERTARELDAIDPGSRKPEGQGAHHRSEEQPRRSPRIGAGGLASFSSRRTSCSSTRRAASRATT